MDIFKFENKEHLAKFMCEMSAHGYVSCVVLDFCESSELIKELCSHDIEFGNIQISEYDYTGYDKEYYITLDSDFILDVSPAWNSGDSEHASGYIYNDADLYLISGDAKSSILKLYEDSLCYELEFGSRAYLDFYACNDCCKDCSGCKKLSEDDDFKNVENRKYVSFSFLDNDLLNELFK